MNFNLSGLGAFMGEAWDRTARGHGITACVAPWASSVVQNELENAPHGYAVGLTELETGINTPGTAQRQPMAFAEARVTLQALGRALG